MKGGKMRTTGPNAVDGETRTVATEGTDADGKKFKTKAFTISDWLRCRPA